MNTELKGEIEGLRKLTTKQLQQRYRELFGEASPSSNSMHLFRRIAWRLQARAHGGLSETARLRATELAAAEDLRLRAPRQFWRDLVGGSGPRQPESGQRDPRLPSPGSVLRRSYRGRNIVAKVLDRGFEHEGRRYGSLSAIAYKATGTRWNGFLFFRLTGQDRG
jgi:Protein of unknown function (DUF2924)